MYVPLVKKIDITIFFKLNKSFRIKNFFAKIY
jgi:hypothetical protein